MWSNKLSDKVTKLNVGNERVIAMEIDLGQKFCLINTYMPTNKQGSEHAYRECLDVLHDIISRYEHSHNIILCGDLNGTLLVTRNNKHDVMLKDFVKEHMLSCRNSSLDPTFYHFNGYATSQIDYVLSNCPELVWRYSICKKDPLNVSPHVPVTVLLKLTPEVLSSHCRAEGKQCKPKKVFSWNRLDQDTFTEHVQTNLNIIGKGDSDDIIKTITTCLKAAADQAVSSKILKFKGPKRPASKETLSCIKLVKETYKKWEASGKPRYGPLFLENKLAKRTLRSQQRTLEAVKRKSFYDSLMENPTNQKFYQLIKRARSKQESNATCIQENGVRHFDSGQQRRCFAQYFEDLAIPKDQKYDNIFLELCNVRVTETETRYRCDTSTDVRITESEVGIAIDQLNNGKAPDEYGLSSEHFKAAKSVIVPVLTDLFNQILTEKKVPATFKTGIITPVLKKGKDAKCMENYRGITVSSAFGKLFEYTVLSKLKFEQSDHQFGFTKGLSPTMASLLVSEAKAEARLNHESLYFATLDSQKAFDVVHHTILLEKLSDKGIQKDIWLIIKDLYTDISSKVKWLGDCSQDFPINQGVRQGGILSTHLYKVYIDPLLEILKSKRLGFRLGTVYIGSPTVADDVTFLTKLREELQLMFGEAGG